MPLQFGKRRENYETGTRHCTGARRHRAVFAGRRSRPDGLRLRPAPHRPRYRAIPEGIAAQTAQSLKNIQAILAEQGMTLADVVKTTVFLADMNDFAEMNKVYGEYFAQPFPARSAVQVAKLPKGAPLEIECIAVK